MKEGWEYKKLGEVCDKTVNIKWDEHPNQQFKYIDLSAVDRVTHKVLSTSIINSTDAPSRAKQLVREGDVLFATTRPTLKRLVIIDKSLDGQICSTGFCVLRPDLSAIKSSWLYYALSSQSFYNYIEPLQKGASYPAVTDNQVKSYKIPVPPLSEQQRIVSYLDSAFAKIDAVAKNAEATLNEAKALFQSALAKMMEPKEGWEEVTLDNICSIESTLVDPTDDNYNNLLHVGGANIESYTGRLINLMTAKDERLTSGKYLFDSNVVLYNKVRPYLVKVARPDFNGLCSADMYPLTPKKETTREFLYYLLIKKEFTNYAIKCSARAGMPKINRNSLFAYKASIPLNRKEQIRIVSTLDNIRKVLMHLESNLSHTLAECEALKQAILRQTFE
jgi:type I restriction enzyme S subunit